MDLDELAAQMDGATGADIESLCKKATLLAIAKYPGGEPGAAFAVRRADFESVTVSHRGSHMAANHSAPRPRSTDGFALAGRIHLEDEEDRS